MIIRRVKQSSFECQPVEDTGAGNGAQEVDAGDINAGLFDEGFELGGEFKGIFVETVDEAAVHAYPCLTDMLDALNLTCSRVVELLVGMVAAIGEALNADQEGAATGAGKGIEQSGLFAKCGGGLTYPFDVEGLQLAKELFGILFVGVDGVVEKEENPFVLFQKGFNLPENGGNGSVAQTVAIHDVDVAEVATEGAATGGLHHVGGEVALDVERTLPNNTLNREVGKGGNPVLRLEGTSKQILLNIAPDIVGLANDERIGMVAALVGEDGDVRATEHHLDASGAKRPGKLKGWPDGASLHADTSHVPMLVERQLLKTQVAEGLAHSRNLLGAENHQRQRWNSELCPPNNVAQGAIFQGAEEAPFG